MFSARDLDPCQRERLEAGVVDVGDLAVRDADPVDLQRIDRLERLLPALVLHRRLVRGLPLQVLAVGVDLRAVDAEVRDQASEEEGLPLHAGVEALHLEHRRIGMLVLDDDEVGERQRAADGMEAQPPDVRRVALEPLVHLAFDVAAQRLVDEERRDDDQRHEQRDASEDPPAAPAEPRTTPSHPPRPRAAREGRGSTTGRSGSLRAGRLMHSQKLQRRCHRARCAFERGLCPRNPAWGEAGRRAGRQARSRPSEGGRSPPPSLFLGGVVDLAEADPPLAVEPDELLLLDRIEVRRGPC